MAPSDTTPLVGSPKIPTGTSSRPVSTGTITTLGVVRAVTAAALMFAPQLTTRLFLLDLPAAASTVTRMIGAREAALSVLLLVGSRRVAVEPATYRDGLRMAIMAGICADLLDIVAGVVDVASGSIGMGTFDMVAGGALLAVGLGVVGLRGL